MFDTISNEDANVAPGGVQPDQGDSLPDQSQSAPSTNGTASTGPVANNTPEALSLIAKQRGTEWSDKNHKPMQSGSRRYNLPVDAVAAMTSAQSWGEFNQIVQDNSDWLSNARYSAAMKEASTVVNHVVNAKRQAEKAAFDEKVSSFAGEMLKKTATAFGDKISQIEDTDFMVGVLPGIIKRSQQSGEISQDDLAAVNGAVAKSNAAKTSREASMGGTKGWLDTKGNFHADPTALVGARKDASIELEGVRQEGRLDRDKQMAQYGIERQNNGFLNTEKLLKHKDISQLVNENQKSRIATYDKQFDKELAHIAALQKAGASDDAIRLAQGKAQVIANQKERFLTAVLPDLPTSAVGESSTTAPAASAPASAPSKYGSESDARSAGAKSGDVIYLEGVGKVRLK